MSRWPQILRAEDVFCRSFICWLCAKRRDAKMLTRVNKAGRGMCRFCSGEERRGFL